MPIYKNKASQKLAVTAIDTSTGALKTGDAGNITGAISKDGGASAATNDANPTELDSTNHPGVYIFDLATAETNADLLALEVESSTGNISLGDPLLILTQDMPEEEANTELAGIPTAVSSLRQMIQYAFEQFRNASTMNKTTGVETLMKEDGTTPLGTRTHTDDGTTWTKPEMS